MLRERTLGGDFRRDVLLSQELLNPRLKAFIQCISMKGQHQ